MKNEEKNVPFYFEHWLLCGAKIGKS